MYAPVQKDCFEFLSSEEFKGNMLGKKFIIGGSQLYNHVYQKYNDRIDVIYETIINYNMNLDKIKNNNIPYTTISFNIDQEFKKMNVEYIDDCKIIINMRIIY